MRIGPALPWVNRRAGQIAAVREVLTEIDAIQVPDLLVFNKADVAPDVAADLVAQLMGEAHAALDRVSALSARSPSGSKAIA